MGPNRSRTSCGPLGWAAGLREPRPSPNLVTLSPAQIDALLAKAKEILHEAYASLIELTAGSGIRLDEALHLDLTDVDEQLLVLTITPKPSWTTKSYRYRRIPVSERTVAAIKRFCATREDVPVDGRTIWSEIKLARVAAGLPKLSMHDLRRAWASAVHANGASLKQIAVWLGHRDIQTTERYVRVFDDGTDGHQYLPR